MLAKFNHYFMHQTDQTLHFIMTGGTIDSYYEPSKDTAVPNDRSIIPQYISSLKLYRHTEFTTICLKDSREISNVDVDNLLKAIEESPYERIIVTHGTYTMPDTARFIKANLTRKGQVIVLTASAIPIKGFSPSDGPFNLGYAVGKIDSMEPGVYVLINGKAFEPEEVMKIMSQARFGSIFNR